jgi:hypothetical protein
VSFHVDLTAGNLLMTAMDDSANEAAQPTALGATYQRAAQMRHLLAHHERLIEWLLADGDTGLLADARRMLPRMRLLLHSLEDDAAAEERANGAPRGRPAPGAL